MWCRKHCSFMFVGVSVSVADPEGPCSPFPSEITVVLSLAYSSDYWSAGNNSGWCSLHAVSFMQWCNWNTWHCGMCNESTIVPPLRYSSTIVIQYKLDSFLIAETIIYQIDLPTWLHHYNTPCTSLSQPFSARGRCSSTLNYPLDTCMPLRLVRPLFPKMFLMHWPLRLAWSQIEYYATACIS